MYIQSVYFLFGVQFKGIVEISIFNLNLVLRNLKCYKNYTFFSWESNFKEFCLRTIIFVYFLFGVQFKGLLEVQKKSIAYARRLCNIILEVQTKFLFTWNLKI